MNDVDYLLGGFGGLVYVEFIRCVFDGPITTGGPIIFTTLDCAIVAQPNLEVDPSRCPWPDATRTASGSPSAAFTPAWDAAMRQRRFVRISHFTFVRLAQVPLLWTDR
jgi:hypothetical protein